MSVLYEFHGVVLSDNMIYSISFMAGERKGKASACETGVLGPSTCDAIGWAHVRLPGSGLFAKGRKTKNKRGGRGGGKGEKESEEVGEKKK